MITLYAIVFYLLAALILIATSLAVSRKNPVHAVVFLIFSFIGSAALFFLLGAPFLAALEIIIYAGAIMILFLFVIMMLRVDMADQTGFSLGHWMPSIVVGLLFLALSASAVFRDPGSAALLKLVMATPKSFGLFVFEHYWLAVEIISVLLLIALMAAVLVGENRTDTAHAPAVEKGAEQ